MPRSVVIKPGDVFTRLTVVKRAPKPDKAMCKSQAGRSFWLCDCTCGNQKSVPSNALQSGMTKSCGCIRRERARSGAANAARSRWKTNARA